MIYKRNKDFGVGISVTLLGGIMLWTLISFLLMQNHVDIGAVLISLIFVFMSAVFVVIGVILLSQDIKREIIIKQLQTNGEKIIATIDGIKRGHTKKYCRFTEVFICSDNKGNVFQSDECFINFYGKRLFNHYVTIYTDSKNYYVDIEDVVNKINPKSINQKETLRNKY